MIWAHLQSQPSTHTSPAQLSLCVTPSSPPGLVGPPSQIIPPHKYKINQLQREVEKSCERCMIAGSHQQ